MVELQGWKMRDQSAGMKNMGKGLYGQLNGILVIVLMQALELK